MAQSKDYYAVLGVSATATQDEIKKQFRRLASQYHPDRNPDDAKAADRFKDISEANNVLGDVEKRKQYDEMRRLGAFGGFGAPGGARRPGRPGTPGGAGAGGTGSQDPSSFRFEDFDIGGIGGLGDLFGSMFGGAAGRPGAAGAGGGRARAGAERGQSIETTLEVPFRTAALGGKLPVELDVTEECATCRGSGGAPGAAVKPCPECAGRGSISFGQGGFAVSRPCPMCMGRGMLPSERCATCNGAGEVRTRKKLLITVPAGAEAGSKVRLKGQGGRGSAGGPAGDLIVTFQVKPDADFTREGHDVLVSVTINVAQAALGSRASVRTLDDRSLDLRIPAGTSSGRRFRIPKQGIARSSGERGDLLVEVKVEVPATLTPAQQQAMRAFAEQAGLEF